MPRYPTRILTTPATFTVTINGRVHEIELSAVGRFQPAKSYRGESPYDLNHITLDAVIRALTQLDDGAAVKAVERKMKQGDRAAMKIQPQPALMVAHDGTLERIIVRGVHQSTSKILITKADGTKASIARWFGDNLLKVLSAVDEHKLSELLADRLVKAKSLTTFDSTTYYDARANLPSIPGLTARYNAANKQFEITFDGKLFSSKALSNLDEMIFDERINRAYPYRVQSDGKLLVVSSSAMVRDGNEKLFATRIEAQAYIVAYRAWAEVNGGVKATVDANKIDLSRITQWLQDQTATAKAVASAYIPECPECGAPPGQAHGPTCQTVNPGVPRA